MDIVGIKKRTADTAIVEVLKSSAEVFVQLCQAEKFANFFGLRDFYTFVKQLFVLHSGQTAKIHISKVMHALYREFGTTLFRYISIN